MRRTLVALLLLTTLGFAQVATRTANLKRNDGLLPFFWDEKKGDLLVELSPALLQSRFLHFTSLATGIGSTSLSADRSGLGSSGLVRFERNGNRVFVIEENWRFRAEKGSPELKRAVERSFPTSMLAALPIEAEENGTLLVKANPLIVRDAFGVIGQLRRPTRFVGGQTIREGSPAGASWRLDEGRSGISPENTKAFPQNTEIESILTFVADGGGGDMNQPNSALTVHQHQSFVALPEPGYEPLERDPRVGFLSLDFDDFSRPFTDLPGMSLALRWRLQKKDPTAALSEPVKPITFYIDPAIPEPIRSAAKRGTLWWNQAFAAAGFKDAIRVADLPPGADPMDIRYPGIQWTNRNGRGWSVGSVSTDVRTGEIIHGIVQLDSHRMRTTSNFWEAMTPPPSRNPRALSDPGVDMFSELDGAGGPLPQEQIVANRLATLAAHEIGHVLGLDHNFVASTFDRGSVMDYYEPRVAIRPDGSFDMSDAYMQQVGSYDIFAIRWGYSAIAAAEREKIALDYIAKGIVYGNYSDPRWNAYDDGPDPVTNLKTVLPVRNALLAKYGPQLLQPGEPVSALQSRLPLVYLFHRYAIAAAANVIGSAKIPPALAGDGQKPVEVWPQASQREALRLLTVVLEPRNLALPAGLWKWLAPVEDSSPDPERFRSTAGYLFNPLDGPRAIAELVDNSLLDAEKFERLRAIRAYDQTALSGQEVIGALVQAAFASSAADPAVAAVLQTALADRLMNLAVNENATAATQAEAWRGLEILEDRLRTATSADGRALLNQIGSFRKDPVHNPPKHRGAQPPAGPPI